MKTKLSFPWLKRILFRGRRPGPAAPGAEVVPQALTFWMRGSGARSLRDQRVVPRRLEDRMAVVEQHLQTCPIAPLQEQMQTVWFSLVHEYLRNKEKENRHDCAVNG